MLGFDYRAWGFWLQAAQAFCTLLVFLYVWLANRQMVTVKHIKDIKCTVEGHGDRLTVLETDIRHLPARREMADLGEKIANLNKNLGVLEGRLSGINRAVDLLNQHHLNGGGKQ